MTLKYQLSLCVCLYQPARQSSSLSAECSRTLLVCFLWVLKNADAALLERWVSDLSVQQINRLLDLLHLCISCFEYKVKHLLSCFVLVFLCLGSVDIPFFNRGKRLWRGLIAWHLKNPWTWRRDWRRQYWEPLGLVRRWFVVAEVVLYTVCVCFCLRCFHACAHGTLFTLLERSPYGSQENVRWRKNVTHWRQNTDRVDKYGFFILFFTSMPVIVKDVSMCL